MRISSIAARRLLDRELAAREVHLDGVERVADALREVAHLEQVRLGEHHGPLDGVLELAHVARPRVLEQELARLGRDAADAGAEARVVAQR